MRFAMLLDMSTVIHDVDYSVIQFLMEGSLLYQTRGLISQSNREANVYMDGVEHDISNLLKYAEPDRCMCQRRLSHFVCTRTL